jgi:drug/metabolite transporter (DMT)-like permease
MTKSKYSIVALLLLIILGFIWGSGYTLARYCTTHGVSPLGYALWQSLGPALVLVILIAIFRISWPLSWQHLRFYFICGLVGIALPNTNIYFASPHLPAGMLAVIVNTVPILTYVLAFIFRQERFYYSRFLGVILGMLGLFLIVQMNFHEVKATPWIFLALLTPLCFAFTATYIARQERPEVHAFVAAASMMLFSSLLLLPAVLVKNDFYGLHWPLILPDQAIVLEIILSSIGYLMMFQILKMAGAVYYSFVSCIVALTGLFWGWLVFGETLSIRSAFAVGLILLALLLITMNQMQKGK